MKIFKSYTYLELSNFQAKNIIEEFNIKELIDAGIGQFDRRPVDKKFLAKYDVSINFDSYNRQFSYQQCYVRFYEKNFGDYKPFQDRQENYFFVFRLNTEEEFKKLTEIIGSDLNEDVC